jgi:uncharacterized protein
VERARVSDAGAVERDPGLSGVVPFRFACHRCARCCSAGTGYVWVEDDECDALAGALGMSAGAFVARHLRRVRDPHDGRERLALREAHGDGSGDHGGRCSLRVGRNECSVSAARPRHCREFPYWDRVLAGGAAFERARETCPGIAVVVDEPVRSRAHAELAALYASLEPAPARSACCLSRADGDDVFATGLETDYAIDAGGKVDGCRLGAGAPLACRAGGDPERFAVLFARLRAIERDTGYPVAYGRLRDLLRARGAAEASRAAEASS